MASTVLVLGAFGTSSGIFSPEPPFSGTSSSGKSSPGMSSGMLSSSLCLGLMKLLLLLKHLPVPGNSTM